MMTWEALHLSNLKDHNLLWFVFFSTLLTYHFHSLVNVVYPASSERHFWNDRNQKILILFMLLALLGTIYFFIPFIRRPIPFLLGGLFTFLYSAPNLKGQAFILLRKIAVGKTLYLAFMWTYATSILPIMALDPGSHDILNAFTGSRFFLVYAICVLFDRRDKLEDQLKGIKALPTLLHENALRKVYFLSLLLSMIFTIIYTWPHFNSTTFFLLVPALICLFLFGLTQHRKGDLLYYVLLDGLMMMSAILQAIYLFSSTFVNR